MIRNILLMLCILAGSAAAQQKTKTTIVTFALGGPQGGYKAFFKNGEEIQPFVATSSGLGAPIKYEGSPKFEIRATEEDFDPPPAGQQPKPPLAAVNLPPGMSNLLIIVAEDAQQKIRLIPYDISPNSLKEGDYKVFNFSRSAVGLRLGKQQLTLEPAKNAVMTDPSWNDPNTKVMDLKLYKADANNKAVLVKTSLWEHWNTKRILMFLFDGRHKGEPLAMITCNVEPPVREEAVRN